MLKTSHRLDIGLRRFELDVTWLFLKDQKVLCKLPRERNKQQSCLSVIATHKNDKSNMASPKAQQGHL